MLRTCRYQPCCTFTYFWHGVSDIHLVAQFQPGARKPETIHFDFRLCRLRSKRHDQPKRSIIMSRRGRQVGSRRTVQKSEWRSDLVLASSQSRSHARCLAPFLPSLARVDKVATEAINRQQSDQPNTRNLYGCRRSWSRLLPCP